MNNHKVGDLVLIEALPQYGVPHQLGTIREIREQEPKYKIEWAYQPDSPDPIDDWITTEAVHYLKRILENELSQRR